jgi:hypothetical protein
MTVGDIPKSRTWVRERSFGLGWDKSTTLLMQGKSFETSTGHWIDGCHRSEQRWQGLRNSLAGLFCASLGSLDDQRTASPDLIFPPQNSLIDEAFLSSHFLSHAFLPSEGVCTENLTPFLKLLPFKSTSYLRCRLAWHGCSCDLIRGERS